MSVEEARDLIMAHDQDLVVVLIYSAGCPRSRRVFGRFLELAEKWREEGVFVLALGTDRKKERLLAFLKDKTLPFDPIRLKPWKKGRLDATMGEVGD